MSKARLPSRTGRVAFEQQALLCEEPERPEEIRLSVHGYGAKTLHPLPFGLTGASPTSWNLKWSE